jgi:hypothetical protein
VLECSRLCLEAGSWKLDEASWIHHTYIIHTAVRVVAGVSHVAGPERIGRVRGIGWPCTQRKEKGTAYGGTGVRENGGNDGQGSGVAAREIDWHAIERGLKERLKERAARERAAREPEESCKRAERELKRSLAQTSR